MFYFVLAEVQVVTSQVDLTDKISFGGILVTIVLFGVNLYVTLKANKKSERSAKAAEISAKAAEGSVSISQRAMKFSAESVEFARESSEAGLRSAIAAEESSIQAREANEHIEHQTKLLEADLKNNHYPLILPIVESISIPLLTLSDCIYKDLNIYFKVNAFNVGLGNAYKVSAWLEIDKNFIIDKYKEKKSSEIYNKLHNHSYKINYEMDESEKKDFIATSIYAHDSEEVSITNIPFYSSKIKVTPILRKDDFVKVTIDSYITLIFIDLLYSHPLSEEEEKFYLSNKIKIIIQYQTFDEIESENYVRKEYFLLITEVAPCVTITSNGASQSEIDSLVVSLETKISN